ncbi:glycosyltransferase family 2 protein [Haloarchaeobius baliensis]|uniref:glycosyltransferase family 2 protein n=1 Tax=Haloarchaeobius baliensis TaxID=1670458 RepID=UPI003F88251C
MREPLISVVLTTHNRAELVGDAIESVLSQTYRNIELFVVDDASTDETASVVESYDDDRLTYVRHETNRHLSAARNTGIELADGEYVAFLDDDDRWTERKLERQVERFERAPETDRPGLVYCWMDYCEDGSVVEAYRPTLRGDVYRETLGGQPLGSGSTWLVLAEAFDEVGGFDEAVHRGVDGDFVRRLAREYHVDFVPAVLTKYTVGHGSGRITDEDEASIREAIECHRRTLQKHGDAFRTYPDQEATLRAKVGWRRTQLGSWADGIAEFDRAVRLAPTCRSVYFYMGVAVFHAFERLWRRFEGSDRPSVLRTRHEGATD